MALLGPHWSFLVTDVTEGSAGNGERLVYVYDARKVRLGGLLGELVLPGSKRQFVRRRSRWARDARQVAAAVHVYYGAPRAVDTRRLAARAKEGSAWSPNVCLLGDFNILRRTDVTYGAITVASLEVPMALQAPPGSSVPKNKL